MPELQLNAYKRGHCQILTDRARNEATEAAQRGLRAPVRAQAPRVTPEPAGINGGESRDYNARKNAA